MTKIEQLALWVIDNRYPKSEKDKVSDCEMFQYIVESCTAIREQFVLDALPSDEDVKKYLESTPYYGTCTTEYKEGIENGANWMRRKAIERLTTREEVERPYVELLMECKLQLEYLNLKFAATGTSNAIIERINTLTDGK